MAQTSLAYLPQNQFNSFEASNHLEYPNPSVSNTSLEQFTPNSRDNDPCFAVSRHDHQGDFQFESKAVVIEDRRPKLKRKQTESSGEGLRCEVPGCRYRGTFNRKYELQRHMKKHKQDERLECPILGCHRKGTQAHYRDDKLRLHLANDHTDDENCVCPHPYCQAKAMSLDLMRLHLRNHSFNNLVGEIIAGGRQCYPKHRCPLSNCRFWGKFPMLPAHLRTHNPTNLREHANNIRDMGLDVVTGKFLCPICSLDAGQQQLFEFDDLQKHVLLSHLVSDAQHFLNFRNQMAPYVWSDSNPFTAWSKRPGPFFPTECAFCVEVATTDRFKTTHHLDLLKDLHEFFPFRNQILRIWPEFGIHPVFDDIMPTIDRDDRIW